MIFSVSQDIPLPFHSPKCKSTVLLLHLLDDVHIRLALEETCVQHYLHHVLVETKNQILKRIISPLLVINCQEASGHGIVIVQLLLPVTSTILNAV